MAPYCKAAARAELAGVVGSHFDAERAAARCLIGEQPVQLGQSPCAGVPVGTALPLVCLLTGFAPRVVTDARELFQANASVGMGVQDAFGECMGGTQLE